MQTNESPAMKSKMHDIAEAVAAVKRDLISDLPKMRRAGKTDVGDLRVTADGVGRSDVTTPESSRRNVIVDLPHSAA